MTKSPSVPLCFLSFVLALITSALDGLISWTSAELWPLDFFQIAFYQNQKALAQAALWLNQPPPPLFPSSPNHLWPGCWGSWILSNCFFKKNLLAYWLNDPLPLSSPLSTHIMTRQGLRFSIRMVIGIYYWYSICPTQPVFTKGFWILSCRSLVFLV